MLLAIILSNKTLYIGIRIIVFIKIKSNRLFVLYKNQKYNISEYIVYCSTFYYINFWRRTL